MDRILYNRAGEAVAYIATDFHRTIYQTLAAADQLHLQVVVVAQTLFN